MRGHHVLDIADLLTPDETDEPDGAGSCGDGRDSGTGNGTGTAGTGGRPREAGGSPAGARPPAATARHTAAPADGPSGPSAADGPAAVVSRLPRGTPSPARRTVHPPRRSP